MAKEEQITISKKEYERLKEIEKRELELMDQFKASLEDLKAGRIKRVA